MKPKQWLYHKAIQQFAEDVNGLTSHNVWINIQFHQEFSLFGDLSNFSFRKKVFFDFIRYTLDTGMMKLGKNDESLKGSTASHLKAWQQSFPKSEPQLLTEDGLFHIWFFMPPCPAGFVWLFPQEDGSIYEHWT